MVNEISYTVNSYNINRIYMLLKSNNTIFIDVKWVILFKVHVYFWDFLILLYFFLSMILKEFWKESLLLVLLLSLK